MICGFSGCRTEQNKTTIIYRPPFKGKIAIPEGWLSHSFKLAEHPEVFVSTETTFETVCLRTTFGNYSRKGFLLDAGVELSFDVYLPPGGSIKFALGRGLDSSQYEKNALLSLVAEGDGEIADLGLWNIGNIFKGEKKRWFDYITLVIPKEAGGNVRLTFSLTGFKDDLPPSGTFFLGHPVIVSQDDSGPRTRVIWITLDTLRADHLSCYGYDRPTTPRIDSLAGEGTLFERCISECPWTFPSYAAMFTGRYPSITGATTNLRVIHKAERTLAEIISAHDFATFSVVNSYWVGEKTGLGQGFDTLKEFSVKDAKVAFKIAREWFTSHADEDCFVFIHLMDPHLPFVPKEKYRNTFDPDYRGRFRYGTENYNQYELEDMDLTESEKVHLEALYDEEILGCDEDVGDFLDFLKVNGLYEDSLIIINADHGEEFWEHGGFSHGHQLYDENLHIPLIIRGPGFDGGRKVSNTCAGFDVFPTILEWLELDTPGEINAKSLFEIMDGKVDTENRLLLSEQLYHGAEQKGVSTGRYRYILHTLDNSEKLYDLTDDPEMLVNIATDRRSTARKFRYFATEYMLNEGSGWHVRIYRRSEEEGGARYQGTIAAPSGFADVEVLRFQDGDSLEVEGDKLKFDVSLDEWGHKAFDFTTNDEMEEVGFFIRADGHTGAEGLIYLGPDRLPPPASQFTITILDPMFGLGQPQFGPDAGSFHGVYIWGNSETLREQLTPEIDDATREELKSLGYLH